MKQGTIRRCWYLILLAVMFALPANEVRYHAMGGAFTAVGDDSTTIRANPAGLSYITDDQLSFTTTLSVHPAYSLADYEDPGIKPLGGVSPYELEYDADRDGSSVYYVDENNNKIDTHEYEGEDETFDFILDDIGFDIGSSSVLEEVKNWHESVQLLSLVHDHIHEAGMVPSFSYVAPGFGFSYERRFTVEGHPGVETEENAEKYIYIERDERFSFALSTLGNGPFSFGAGGTYSRRTEIEPKVPTFEEYESYYDEQCDVDHPDEISLQLAYGELFEQQEDEHALFASAGTMLSLGRFTAGASAEVPLAKSFLANPDLSKYINVGIAYETDGRKLSGSPKLLSITAAADLHRVGDHQLRTLHAGGEINLEISRILSSSIRAGYRQELPGRTGSLLEAGPASWIDPDDGEISVGAGMQFFTARIDGAVVVPAQTALRALSAWKGGEPYTWSDARADAPDQRGPVFMLSGSMVF